MGVEGIADPIHLDRLIEAAVVAQSFEAFAMTLAEQE